jgi:hypothetical protein
MFVDAVQTTVVTRATARIVVFNIRPLKIEARLRKGEAMYYFFLVYPAANYLQ